VATPLTPTNTLSAQRPTQVSQSRRCPLLPQCAPPYGCECPRPRFQTRNRTCPARYARASCAPWEPPRARPKASTTSQRKLPRRGRHEAAQQGNTSGTVREAAVSVGLGGCQRSSALLLGPDVVSPSRTLVSMYGILAMSPARLVVFVRFTRGWAANCRPLTTRSLAKRAVWLRPPDEIESSSGWTLSAPRKHHHLHSGHANDYNGRKLECWIVGLLFFKYLNAALC